LAIVNTSFASRMGHTALSSHFLLLWVLALHFESLRRGRAKNVELGVVLALSLLVNRYPARRRVPPPARTGLIRNRARSVKSFVTFNLRASYPGKSKAFRRLPKATLNPGRNNGRPIEKTLPPQRRQAKPRFAPGLARPTRDDATFTKFSPHTDHLLGQRH
jgi:hypothetical protein